MPDWEARNVYPSERFLDCHRRNMRKCIDKYVFNYWTEFFSPRQLLGHCTSVEVFHELVAEIRERHAGTIPDLDKAALSYVAAAMDKIVHYNSLQSRWDVDRVAIRGKFDRHDFAFQWSYGAMAPTVTGLGYDWAIEQTGKSLDESISLGGSESGRGVRACRVLVRRGEHMEPCRTLRELVEYLLSVA